MKKARLHFISSVLVATTLFLGCAEVPGLGSIAPDVRYKNRKQYAISGMEQNIGDFLPSTSSLPLNFEIVEIRESSGKDVSAFKEEIPVVYFKTPIVGGETEEELRLKSDTVSRPAVSLNPFTGKVEILEGNNIPAGEYHFDINVSNTSGTTLLKDAIIIEFREHEVISWSSGMAKAPEIERIADAPNQILFVGHLDGMPIPGNRIDFTTDRASGFKGSFVNDTPEGEIWKVNFPVKSAQTYCSWQILDDADETGSFSYVTENLDFVLGRPGSYVIRLFK
ncbi:DUF5007 domain-containing protein [Sphingobacterium sp. SGR-19]|uniref:DUF5007 domain-containing protein n=1 Tax=Sphingobacterium sp. SGR-19 TaxID=2710886 RepID=UPI0013ED7958|nr:DUF5007 domain-containing protein [Sphingobacterium sp. SGR-19]NGM64111.1 DUF5007 domain-containing protein [Sphingobacterium sp. SGR-19]